VEVMNLQVPRNSVEILSGYTTGGLLRRARILATKFFLVRQIYLFTTADCITYMKTLFYHHVSNDLLDSGTVIQPK
jgi:hypothetical protein